MAPVPPTLPQDPKPVLDLGVLAWRFDQLIFVGYPLEVAYVLAESNVDLHRACDLLTAGATVKQAVDILS